MERWWSWCTCGPAGICPVCKILAGIVIIGSAGLVFWIFRRLKSGRK